jgi:hypothetical protein
MACLIKAPGASGKGCLSFTTPERDQVINRQPGMRAAVGALKQRFLVGLHHNWHDHAFAYDPLFDFSMAGDGDLIERSGRPFARVGLDACNFAPACFAQKPGSEPFWDVLNASRAVSFKGLPEFYEAIRRIYDRGRFIRVLHLCPVPPRNKEGTHLHDIRQRFEAIFSPEERRFFTLMTMEWDNPFPLDLETLAFFYRSSRVYVHPSPDERRCRVAAYAWASGSPVVARENVASIVSRSLRRRPFWFGYDDPSSMGDTILAALDADKNDPEWDTIADEFRTESSARRLDAFLLDLALGRGESLSQQPINALGLDIRLGRHHGISSGPNAVEQTVGAFCAQLLRMPDSEIASFAGAADPEVALARISTPFSDAAAGSASRHREGGRGSLLQNLGFSLKAFLRQ